MQFGSLSYLWLLLIIPICAMFFLWAFKSKKKALEKFAEIELLSHLLRSVSPFKQKIKPVLFTLGVLLIILSLIQPKWGYRWEEVKRRGLDIVIALDVSKSMLAEDIKPNRLEAAKREIKNLINLLQGDRIAIVGFAGTAFLHCPLTLDYGTAKLFIDNLDVSSIPLGGTNIGDAINKAIRAYEGHEKKHRVLILITDGEDHEQNAMAAAEEAKKHGIVIFTIGIGKKEGAPIPYLDEQGRKGFVKDRNGRIVLSKLDQVLLQKIALTTGGKKGTIGAGNFPLEEIYLEEVSKMEKKELKSTRQKRYENRFQWPLFLAILLFALEAILSEAKKIGEILMKHKYTILISLILLNIFAAPLFAAGVSGKVRRGNNLFNAGKYDEALSQYNDAQIDAPNNSQIYYNMGNVFFKQKKYPEAIDAYRKSMEKGDIKLEAKALYNIGNSHFMQGNLKEALELYKQALERDPEDRDTKYNIEYTEKKIKEMLSKSEETKKQAQKDQNNMKQQQEKQGKQDQKEQEKEDKTQEAQQDKSNKDGDKQAQEKKGKEQSKPSEKKGEEKDKKAAANKKDDIKKEDAERFLSSFDDEKKNMPPVSQEQSQRGSSYHVEKDW